MKPRWVIVLLVATQLSPSVPIAATEGPPGGSPAQKGLFVA